MGLWQRQRNRKNTFVLEIEETNEKGMTMHFLTKEDVYDYYSKFNIINLERSDINFHNLCLLNSDWDIIVEK
jgi:hypothetical protein